MEVKKMKKIVSILSILLMVGALFQPLAIADNQPELLVYVIPNNSTTAALETNVGVTTIIPGKHKILGYTLSPFVSGSGTVWCTLYDKATVATAASTDIFGEDAVANTTSVARIFPYPKKLSTQLTVAQGPYSVVTIYYVREIQ
jgi:hypothetical protein